MEKSETNLNDSAQAHWGHGVDMRFCG